MPTLDMPMAELKEYLGTNPKPNDFDEFWKQRVEETKKVPLEYQITKNDITGYASCTFYDLWFIGIRGEKMYAKYICPTTQKKTPLVLQFHGYPGSSRSWFELTSFVAMGCAIIALDCPGQGGRSQDSGQYVGATVSGHIIAGLDGDPKDMYYVKLYQNICLLVRIVQQLQNIDQNRIYVNGASQGGGLATVCAALNTDVIKKAAILYPFLSDFQRVSEMDRDLVAYEGLRYYCRWFDPMAIRSKEIFTKLGYIDVSNFAPMIKADVLFGCSIMDEICPPSTQFAVYNNLSCQKEVHLFYEYGHEEISYFDDMILDFIGADVWKQ